MGADGGASSSLLGAFVLGMGEATEAEVSSWDCQQLAAALRAGLRAVQVHTKAQPGEKTMMDALMPAVEAFAVAAQAGEGMAAAFRAAAQAAKAGAAATEKLIARYGRARLLGERTLGHQDPGAASIALIFEGFSKEVSETIGGIEHAGH
jgi:dihydroxyacetone kinase-like protein